MNAPLVRSWKLNPLIPNYTAEVRPEEIDASFAARTCKGLPHRMPKRSCDYHPGANAIQIMTMKVSKGLELPVVALPGVGHMPALGEVETEAARVFYVAATRATQRLVMGGGWARSRSDAIS